MIETNNESLQEPIEEEYELGSRRDPTRWEENHGNILLLFVGIIMIIGGGILAYQQSRFVPPRFPDGNLIQTPSLAYVGAIDEREDLFVLRVQGASSDEGNMHIAIFDSTIGFGDPEGAFLAESVAIVEGTAAVGFLPDRLPEQFAIAAYHDENGDGQLSFNQFGIPIESYGFSNNARSFVGPPAFEKAVIERPQPGDVIIIQIQ